MSGSYYRDTGPYIVYIDKASSTSTYVGKAPIGSETSAAKWQIRLIYKSGTVTTVTYADGDDKFDNIIDNRTSLTYS